jgi:uncharacterized YigZ family protein
MGVKDYYIPVGIQRSEITVANSRFITTVGMATSTEEAKGLLSAVRSEMPDASHHVYAFRVGYGNSVVEGLSDDGEPSGTAGPPVMAVLRGSDIGDIIIVVTRYFGGTKLGTGGLVRAYSNAARNALDRMRKELKIARQTIGLEIPYSLYEQIKRLAHTHDGVVSQEDFGSEITLFITLAKSNTESFSAGLIELSAGRVHPIILEDA